MPLAPLNPLPSPVTLSQVEDVLATSKMVQDLTSHHLHPSLHSSSDSPSSSLMAVDIEDAPVDTWSCSLSYHPWVESHPSPDLFSNTDMWMTWLAEALENEVPVSALDKFINTLIRISQSASA
jgi:hypothetical protein